MKFVPRVWILLLLGLVLALIPSQAPDEVSAEALFGSEDLGDAVTAALSVSSQDSESADSGLPNILVLTQGLGVSSVGSDDAATTDVSTDVLGVTETAPTAPSTSTPQAPPTTAPPQAPPTTAAPSTTVAPATTQATLLSLEEQTLALVNFDWQTAFPDWVVEFDSERAGIRGLTYPREQRIELFVRSDDTAETLFRVFAHELGHVVDVELNTSSDRDRWRTQRGIGSDVPWWPSAEAPDFQTGAGDFAEAFAVLETGITSRSSVASQPTAADLELLRELMQG